MRLVGLAFLGVVVACSSRQPQRPPELADCTPVGDASCPSPVTAVGGSAGSGTPDSGMAGAGDSGSVGSGCGAQSLSLLMTTDPTCLACAGANCCPMAQQCTPGDCQNLLGCNQNCDGGVDCISLCENTSMAMGLTQYANFRGCLSLNCSTCPMLPQ
jgi:hypothetical protein